MVIEYVCNGHPSPSLLTSCVLQYQNEGAFFVIVGVYVTNHNAKDLILELENMKNNGLVFDWNILDKE